MFYGEKDLTRGQNWFHGEATHLREEDTNINMVSTDFPAHSEDNIWLN